MDSFTLFSIISIAFLGSFGHCIGMCGGIVIAYSSTKISSTWNRTYQSIAHLLYSFGRITTYITIGIVFGFLGSLFLFTTSMQGVLFILAGTVMILTGLSIFGKIKFLSKIEHTISSLNWYKKTFGILIKKQTLGSFYFLGLLNGLMPCGLIYFFAVMSAKSGSIFWGAITMLIFGISTIPAMFSLGIFVGFLKQLSIRNTIMKIAAISVIIYGFYAYYLAYNLLIKTSGI